MQQGGGPAEPATRRGVHDFPAKMVFLLTFRRITPDTFVSEFYGFCADRAAAGGGAKHVRSPVTKETIRAWLSGAAKPQGKNIERLIEYWKQKDIPLTKAMLDVPIEDFEKQFEPSNAGIALRNGSISIALQFSGQPFDPAQKTALSGKYKSYRYSLSNKHEITEEWILIRPSATSLEVMDIEIYCYPVTGSAQEKFAGQFFQAWDAYYAIVSCPPLNAIGGRCRFLSFPAEPSIETTIRYGMISGTSVALGGEPVAACILMGKMSDSTTISDKELAHVARIDPVTKKRINPKTSTRGSDGKVIDIAETWYETPKITDEILEFLLSNDINLNPVGGRVNVGGHPKGDSVLTVSRHRKRIAQTHFELLKAWYEMNK